VQLNPATLKAQIYYRADLAVFGWSGVPKGNRNHPTETHYNGDIRSPPPETGTLIERLLPAQERTVNQLENVRGPFSDSRGAVTRSPLWFALLFMPMAAMRHVSASTFNSNEI
jgi:hypothetical protein